MRSGNAAQHERILRVFERQVGHAKSLGLVRVRIEDELHDGATITVDGRELINFGNCGYAGLNTDPRLKKAAIDAVERFGAAFSSSAAYASVDLFTELEDRLSRMFQAPVVIPTTTTLGHLSCLPVVVTPGSIVLIDSAAHASLHLAAQVLTGSGIEVIAVPHNDMAELESAIVEAGHRADQIWYIADGVYSMHGDVAPARELARLADTYEKLWLYIDDAHGVGWAGKHGRGVVLERIDLHPKMILAASLVKSIGAGGAALVFPNRELADRVQIAAGPMTFSGPLQPPALAAGIAAADVMLSDELLEIRAELERQIDHILEMGRRLGLPFAAWDRTPIWFLRIGRTDEMLEVAKGVLADGYFVNVSSFPAVPLGQAGIRFTHTVANDLGQLTGLLESLACHIQRVLGDRMIDLNEMEDVQAEV